MDAQSPSYRLSPLHWPRRTRCFAISTWILGSLTALSFLFKLGFAGPYGGGFELESGLLFVAWQLFDSPRDGGWVFTTASGAPLEMPITLLTGSFGVFFIQVPLLPGLLLSAALWARFYRRARRAACVECAYPMLDIIKQGAATVKCPECGREHRVVAR